MFTGIVTDVASIDRVLECDGGRKVRMRPSCDLGPLAIGASIAHNGICLTVVDRAESGDGAGWFDVFIGAETLAVTTAKYWRAGNKINLERSLRSQDELGGHLVSAHVDGVATVTSCEMFAEQCNLVFQVPAELARYIAPKGSVALNGTSLTVNNVSGNTFSVLLIPHTLQVTNWHLIGIGDKVNIEVDQMARYAARLIDTHLQRMDSPSQVKQEPGS